MAVSGDVEKAGKMEPLTITKSEHHQSQIVQKKKLNRKMNNNLKTTGKH